MPTILKQVQNVIIGIVAYPDSFPLAPDLRQARLVLLRELQSATGEELRPFFGRTLLPSVLDRALKGEL